MAESSRHPLPPNQSASSGADRPRQHLGERRRRQFLVQRGIGLVYMAIALTIVLFAGVTWGLGRLTLTNTLVFALAIAGTAPVGILAWRGDYPGARMDEGQREMNYAAQSHAFYIAYLGFYALFFGELYFQPDPTVLPLWIGGLLLVVTLTWMGSYMWYRRRA